MEDVDRITISTLRSIGCEFLQQDNSVNADDAGAVSSLADFSSDNIVEAASRCLALLLEEENVPPPLTSLPSSMSAKFKVAQTLANAVQRLDGYKHGKVGYETFLYPNVRDTRHLLLFLVQKLPTHTAEGAMKDSDLELAGTGMSSQSHLPGIGRVLHHSLQEQAWLPSLCKLEATRLYDNCHILQEGSAFSRSMAPKHMQMHCMQDFQTGGNLPSVLKQAASMQRHELLSTLRQHLLHIALAEAAPTRQPIVVQNVLLHSQPASCIATFLSSQSAAEEAYQMSRKLTTTAAGAASKSSSGRSAVEEAEKQTGAAASTESVEQLEAKLAQLRAAVSQESDQIRLLDDALAGLSAEQTDASREMLRVEGLLAELQGQINNTQKILLLLPDAEEKCALAREKVTGKQQQLAGMEKQWSEKRAEMQQTVVELTELAESRQKSPMHRLKEEVENLREQLQQCQQEQEEKVRLCHQLKVRLSRLEEGGTGGGKDGNVSRVDYTKRIQELTASIRRQRSELNNVMQDLMTLQRELNLLRGKQERTYIVTDSLMKTIMKSSNDARLGKMLSLLTDVHRESDALLEAIAERGRLQRETKELEDAIEVELRKGVAENLTKMKNDEEEMKRNCEELKKQIRAALQE